LRRLAVAFEIASIFAVAESSDARAESGRTWGPFSSTINLTSDYRFRGQSQTNRDVAVQGSIDYKSKSGLFASAWASTIKLNDRRTNAAEVDFSGGYSHSFSETTEGSMTVAYYWYPTSAPARYDYFEIISEISHDYGGFSLNGELTFSPNFSDHTGNEFGTTAGLDVPIAIAGIDWLSASGHLGYQWVANNVAYGTPDWLFYDVGLKATWKMLALDLRYVGTNTTKAACFGGTDLCAAKVVLSLTASLPGK